MLPGGVASDAYGNIYVARPSGNNAIKEIVAIQRLHAGAHTGVARFQRLHPGRTRRSMRKATSTSATNSASVPTSNAGLTNQFVKLDFANAPSLSSRNPDENRDHRHGRRNAYRQHPEQRQSAVDDLWTGSVQTPTSAWMPLRPPAPSRRPWPSVQAAPWAFSSLPTAPARSQAPSS